MVGAAGVALTVRLTSNEPDKTDNVFPQTLELLGNREVPLIYCVSKFVQEYARSSLFCEQRVPTAEIGTFLSEKAPLVVLALESNPEHHANLASFCCEGRLVRTVSRLPSYSEQTHSFSRLPRVSNAPSLSEVQG